MSASQVELPCRDFERLLRSDSQDTPAADWSEVVSLASEQVARWNARLMFSPATSPDGEAAKELKLWEAAYAITSDALVEQVPGVRAAISERHQLRRAMLITERRLKHGQGQRLPGLLSAAAHLANRVGLRHLAQRLMCRALYPKGSVGRAGSF